MHAHRILNIPAQHHTLQQKLSRELGISVILAQLLINRGIKDARAADDFLNAGLSQILDPFAFSDMHKAIGLIKAAVKNKDRIMVFGDYDVDGITSVVLIKSALKRMKAEASCHLPHRIREGYGLSKNILQLARDSNARLLITADCGTSSHEQIKELRKHDIEVIVTDHHEPAAAIPCASAILNPKIQDSGYGYRDLAGVGVAYKLCQALTGEGLAEDLDLVCLGTIADVAPLTGENRVFVKEGLPRLSRTRRPGIKAMIEASGIKGKKMTATFVSYILGPRINASGRMDTADTALRLLLSDSKEEADELARTVEMYNRQRQKIENKIMEEAQGLVDKEINFKEHKIIVIAKEGWHEGVLGIVASKLADRLYRPTILISVAEGLCKGSGRSIKTFHLFAALLECREFLSSFGGHAHAAGLVISKENIADFKNKINSLAKEKLQLEDLLPSLDIDMEVALDDLNEKIIAELQALEPFGAGNPEPLFYTRNLKLKGEPQVLSRETLKFWVTDARATYPAIGFGMGYFREGLINSGNFDLVYYPRIDNWQGAESVILEVKDIFFR
ncbi:MAG: single-stranded-DNA-specific exonuclease RecJ [Candidatus Omnitrophica bacterium]|nr:single-stranded-DNA-specific exonuclease RecJ [Candidatus Omnitrophota bacterium]